jgi:lipopolysaccharide biosynthesis glycosyltransferase
VQTDVVLYKHARVSRHITRAAYLKVFIPELLPREIEKVIYLDCDVIVEEDLSDLWNIDISGYHLGAVLDTTLTDRLSVLVGEAGMPYFNSGVMLLNLRKWREDDTVRVILKFINENHEKLLYHDQDALNAILYKKWLHIDAKWNVQTPMFFRQVKNESTNDISLRYALEKPHIIHYSGRGKPWRYITTHPLRTNYYRYLKLTPWREFRPRITPREIIDGFGLIFKKISPSFFMAARKMLVNRAIGGSRLCSRICNRLHIELEQ